MPEAPRSNRPTPRTAAAIEAELKRRIRADLKQARADVEGDLDDDTLASIIGGAIAAALSWHLESPEHTRNATTSSKTWRSAPGPRGAGGRPRDAEDRPPFQDRGDRPAFGNRPPPRAPFQDRPSFRDRPPFQERGPRDFDAPPRREPRDFDQGDGPRREPRDFGDRDDFGARGPQARPPFKPRSGGSRPSGGGGFGRRPGGGGGRPPNRGGGGFGPRRAPPRGR